MEEKQVLEILGKVGAVITGSHIVYTSGKHGSAYVNKDALYPHTFETSRLCRVIAEEFIKDDIQVVIAPAVGGVILSQWVAYELTNYWFRARVDHPEILGVYAEKGPDDTFVIKRGYDKLIKGKRVLVVEDVLTTGGSVKKVIEATRAIGEVVGLGVLCNRGGITPADVGDVPRLFALANAKLDAWDEADCPLCAQGVPINTDVGKGREFLAHKKT
jgi:orotate phosphoribosyltransferase